MNNNTNNTTRENELYNDINIFNTLEDIEEKEELLNKFIDNLFNRDYNVYRNYVNQFRNIIDSNYLDKINDAILEFLGIDLVTLFNIDNTFAKSSFDIYLTFLDQFHNDLPKSIAKTFKKYNVTSIDELENINEIIKNIRSKLKGIIKMLDYDTAYNLVIKSFELYKSEIILNSN